MGFRVWGSGVRGSKPRVGHRRCVVEAAMPGSVFKVRFCLVLNFCFSWGFGFRVPDLGFRGESLGFRVWKLGFGVCGLGFRVWG